MLRHAGPYPEVGPHLHQPVEELVHHPDVFQVACEGRIEAGDALGLVVAEDLPLVGASSTAAGN